MALLGGVRSYGKSYLYDTIRATAEGILLQDGWQAFSKSLADSIEGGGTLPVFCADFNEAELPLGTVMAITNSIYSRLRASESYKYVGDQYETQYILRQYLNIVHGKGSDAFEAALLPLVKTTFC